MDIDREVILQEILKIQKLQRYNIENNINQNNKDYSTYFLQQIIKDNVDITQVENLIYFTSIHNRDIQISIRITDRIQEALDRYSGDLFYSVFRTLPFQSRLQIFAKKIIKDLSFSDDDIDNFEKEL